jgi:hypothetical protein
MKSNERVKSECRHPDLTIEDVRACEKFKDLSEEQAKQVVDTIRTYTEIIYTCYQQGKLSRQSNTHTKLTNIKISETNKAA